MMITWTKPVYGPPKPGMSAHNPSPSNTLPNDRVTLSDEALGDAENETTSFFEKIKQARAAGRPCGGFGKPSR
jgi:hypothetical protein